MNVASVQYAGQRVGDFAKVNFSRDAAGKLEAVDVLLNSKGLDPAVRSALFDELKNIVEVEEIGSVMLGILFAMFMVEHAAS